VLCGCLRILLRCCHCCCHVGRLARLRRLITTVKWTRAACCQFVPVPCSIVTTSPASAALDLTDVHAKLDRAEEHINDLSDEIDSFVNGESYGSFEARLNPIDESYSMIFRENKPLPVSRWGVLLGDACHNLRCALNYLLCALVPPGQVHCRHQFPISDTAHSWKSELGRKNGDMMLDFVDPAHVALIESVQPYQPHGVQRLSTLERFSNADKHRLIHAAASNLIDKPQIAFARVVPVAISDVSYPPPGEPVRDGTEVARFKGDMQLNLIPQPLGRFDIQNSSMHIEAAFKGGILFGDRGGEDTPAPIFRLILSDIRDLITRFDHLPGSSLARAPVRRPVDVPPGVNVTVGLGDGRTNGSKRAAPDQRIR